MKKLFTMFMVAFAMVIGFGAVSSSTAEARHDVYVCDNSSNEESYQIYIDTDSAELITHTTGKGVDNYYKIRADFYASNGLRFSNRYEVMFVGNQIQILGNGFNMYPLRGAQGKMFTSAWYYAMGYPFS